MDPRVAPLLPIIESFGLGAATIDEVRRRFQATAAAIPAPDGVTVEATAVAGREAVRVRPDGGDVRGRILYLHGGGYVIGSTTVQLGVPGRLALATAHEVISVDYRLAPEHVCPAATFDAVAAYEELLADGPVAAIAGDSAGGALAVSTAVALRDAGIALPDALVAFSPWTDLGGTEARVLDPGFEDAVLPRAFLRMAAAAVLGGRDPDDPTATPVTADVRGLPRTIIHVGGDELLLDDSLRLAAHLAGHGVEVALRVWPGMIHIFVAYPQLVPESDRALAEVARFLDR